MFNLKRKRGLGFKGKDLELNQKQYIADGILDDMVEEFLSLDIDIVNEFLSLDEDVVDSFPGTINVSIIINDKNY